MKNKQRITEQAAMLLLIGGFIMAVRDIDREIKEYEAVKEIPDFPRHIVKLNRHVEGECFWDTLILWGNCPDAGEEGHKCYFTGNTLLESSLRIRSGSYLVINDCYFNPNKGFSFGLMMNGVSNATVMNCHFNSAGVYYGEPPLMIGGDD